MDSLVEVCRIIRWCYRRKYAGENEDFIISWKFVNNQW
jgi:hypothetical protein